MARTLTKDGLNHAIRDATALNTIPGIGLTGPHFMTPTVNLPLATHAMDFIKQGVENELTKMRVAYPELAKIDPFNPTGIVGTQLPPAAQRLVHAITTAAQEDRFRD
jgi:hypothetical protein